MLGSGSTGLVLSQIFFAYIFIKFIARQFKRIKIFVIDEDFLSPLLSGALAFSLSDLKYMNMKMAKRREMMETEYPSIQM